MLRALLECVIAALECPNFAFVFLQKLFTSRMAAFVDFVSHQQNKGAAK
jgi:hypothetical protein